MMRADGGKAIFVENLGSQSVRTDPVRGKDEDGNPKIFYTRRTMKAVRRKSSPPGLRDESSKMTPGRPTNGSIDLSNYGLMLDGFVGGWKRARRLFASRRTPRHKGGVPHELTMQAPGRAILFMPGIGKLNSQGINRQPIREVKTLRLNADGGYEILDGDVWTMIASQEAKELLESGAAQERP